MRADPHWHDDEITSARNDKGEDDTSQLRDLLDRAVSAIETSATEKARIQWLISDLERYVGRSLDQYSYADLAAYEALAGISDLRFNVCFSVVNTMVSRVCSFRPRAQFVPEHGNYKTQRLTRDLTGESDAWAQEQEYQVQATMAFRDGLTGPGGVLKFYAGDDGSPEMGRFPAWELKLDEDDWKYGQGECSYHVRYITQESALRQYGDTEKAREAIALGTTRLAEIPEFERFCNRNGRVMTRVVDAYKRGPDGRHVIMAGDHVALNAEWQHNGHPFIITKYDQRTLGPWGNSAISFIRGIQDAVDRHLQRIEEATHLTSSLFISTPEDHPGDITNDVVQLYKRSSPTDQVTFHNPNPVPPAIYNWFHEVKQFAFEVLGVSTNAAQATKPPGVTAKIAIEAVTDLQSDRLSPLSQMWEQMVVQAGQWWYALSADNDEAPKEYDITSRGRSRRVKFQKLGRKPTIRTFPTSLFGQSIPARLDRAMDMVEAKWISQEEAMKLLDIPDLGSVIDLQLAEFYYVEEFVDDVLEDGHYETPDDYADPAKFYNYARKRYMLALADKSYPPEHLSQMRKLLDYLQGKGKETEKPAQAPQLAAPPLGLPPMPQTAPVTPPPLPGLAQTPEAPLAA